MSHRDHNRIFSIHFYATAPYPCSYLPGRQARSQVAIPADAIDDSVYSQLVHIGFRRSGLFTYRPYCDQCDACVSVRIPVAQFAPNRTQRRVMRRHCGQLQAIRRPLAFVWEHYELYRRYQASRHAEGSMADDNHHQYAEFILKSAVSSELVEFRDGDGQLKMVSLIDVLGDGLSAVYTFFEPDEPQASYGVYNVLWQVEESRRRGLPYLYLGYWIAACRKMAYKTHYRPLERLRQGRWVSDDAQGADAAFEPLRWGE